MKSSIDQYSGKNTVRVFYGTLHGLRISDDVVQRLLLRFLLCLLGAVVRLLAEAEAGPPGTPQSGATAQPLVLSELCI